MVSVHHGPKFLGSTRAFQDLKRSDSFGFPLFDGSLKSMDFYIFIIPLVLKKSQYPGE